MFIEVIELDMALVFFGSANAEIRLAYLIQNYFKEKEIENITLTSTAAYFVTIRNFPIYMVNNAPQFQSLQNLYYKPQSIGVYCVDLSVSPINYQAMANEIKAFRNSSNFSDVLLVGINSNHASQDEKERIEAIRNELNENQVYIPSNFTFTISNEDKLDELIERLQCLKQEIELTKQAQQRIHSPWEKALSQLNTEIRTLPYDKMVAIGTEIEHLKTVLEQPGDVSVKEEAIKTFSKNCHTILEGQYPNILKTVLTLAAVAVVTIVAGLIGFGLGFAAGLWTGPGAFFSGFLTGAAFATGIVSGTLGLISGGLVAHSLFKPSKEAVAVNNFAEQARITLSSSE